MWKMKGDPSRLSQPSSMKRTTTVGGQNPPKDHFWVPLIIILHPNSLINNLLDQEHLPKN
jgi:hypothetical protein